MGTSVQRLRDENETVEGASAAEDVPEPPGAQRPVPVLEQETLVQTHRLNPVGREVFRAAPEQWND